jgi:hypothetical protein
MDDIYKTTTLNEIAKVLGKDKSTISRRANSEKWVYTEELNKIKAFPLDSLPKEIREKINISRLNENLSLEDSIAEPVLEPTSIPPKITVLDDKQRERDGARRLILQFLT